MELPADFLSLGRGSVKLNYITLIQIITTHIYLENIYKSHNPAFFICAVPNAGPPSAPDLYLKGGSHDGVSKAQ